MSADTLKTCVNQGCKARYNESENTPESCRYHPKPPLFRDILKTWPCCGKKSRDFSEFMAIPGCTLSYHTDQAPQKEEISQPTIVPSVPEKVEPPTNIPIQLEYKDDTSALISINVHPTQSLIDDIAKLELNKPKALAQEQKISETNAEIVKCLNNCCNQVFINENYNYEKCVYHPGSPMFHEGMKFWTCCKKRTYDFEDLWKQPGCTTGEHKWKLSDEEIMRQTECRVDYSDLGVQVNIAVYAKHIRYDKCKVLANKTQIKIEFHHEEGVHYSKEFKLFGEIDPTKINVTATPFKLDITARKMFNLPWPKLQH